MSKENKRIVRKLFEGIWNGGDTKKVIAKTRSKRCVSAGLGTAEMKKSAQYESFVALAKSVLSRTHFEIEKLVADKDHVCVRGTLSGRTRDGKKVSLSGIGLARVKNGRIVESWNSWDALALEAQLAGKKPRSLVDVLRGAAKTPKKK